VPQFCLVHRYHALSAVSDFIIALIEIFVNYYFVTNVLILNNIVILSFERSILMVEHVGTMGRSLGRIIGQL